MALGGFLKHFTNTERGSGGFIQLQVSYQEEISRGFWKIFSGSLRHYIAVLGRFEGSQARLKRPKRFKVVFRGISGKFR